MGRPARSWPNATGCQHTRSAATLANAPGAVVTSALPMRASLATADWAFIDKETMRHTTS
jgi:hypothetical protein